MFEKFWTSGGGGAGLGLAIARQIARAHGSDLTLESRPGDRPSPCGSLPRRSTTTTRDGDQASSSPSRGSVIPVCPWYFPFRSP